MESQLNLETLASQVGLPLTNVNSSPTSADAPLLDLLGCQFHELTPEKARALVEQLRTLRKNPQKLSSKMTDGTATKRAVRKQSMAAAKVANLVNEYGDL